MEIEIGAVTTANLQQFRLINCHTLPVRYTDKFYSDLLTSGQVKEENIKFAINNGFTIGTVCARYEINPETKNRQLYIMILNVLPAYRRRGVASQLLLHVFKNAAKEKDVEAVKLHVQTSNQEAIDFYTAKNFKNIGRVDNYYKRVDPPDAYVLQIDIAAVRALIDAQPNNDRE